MPDWNSPAELAVEGAAFAKFMHALAGLYFWEFATSLDFDWAFITGKKKLHWPLIFYFLDRYLLFFAMIGILIALDVTTEVNCQVLYTFNQLVGDAAVGLASINLAIRTMALWSEKMFIVIPLVIIILGHWSLILQGVLLKAEWEPGTGCVITKTNTTILAATFIYSMCFDLVVLVLSAIKLAFGEGQRSQLMDMLFRDGLVYFMIAFIANLLATIFMLLNLSSIMSVIFNVPAAVASTIVACRAVRRLNRWSSAGPEVLYVPHLRANTHLPADFRPAAQARAQTGPSPSAQTLSLAETAVCHTRMVGRSPTASTCRYVRSSSSASHPTHSSRRWRRLLSRRTANPRPPRRRSPTLKTSRSARTSSVRHTKN
ncbi:hypothetical protein PHLGIDRAFT_98489 [Phlebiopsis gigantea 11061_1 CR5-6]|uniref:Transmembrane protein n=1 Tax=Phlebiopsis gigantea (strain 11061_1 CR5-6) TaxID=745531 RepID=A0A0C3S6Z2_PHLG1|nr:hypothetical protein PHLGIDRAFT_98489 [Phlebiopsis gigantea 11061_1 CR5-6]